MWCYKTHEAHESHESHEHIECQAGRTLMLCTLDLFVSSSLTRLYILQTIYQFGASERKLNS